MISSDTASLGGYANGVENALKELRDERVVERMWEGDHTVWGPEPEEIANRLGWLVSPEATEGSLPEIMGLVEAVRGEGVGKFMDSFDEMLETIREKGRKLVRQ